MPQLSGHQIEQLQEALLDAFPSNAVLNQLVLLQLDENIDAIAGGVNLTEITFNLIVWAARKGRLHHLWDAALEANPSNRTLQSAIASLQADLGTLVDGEPLELPDLPDPPTPIPRWLIYGGATLLIAIAGILLFFFWSSEEGEQNTQGAIAEVQEQVQNVQTLIEQTPTPIGMTGPLFNIAVANIGELDSAGTVQPSDLGADLSRLIFNGLDEQVNNPANIDKLPRISRGDIQVWHLGNVLDTARLDRTVILGDDAANRGADAAMIAQKINADMVVYGNLRDSDDPTSLELEFYFDSPQLRDQPDAVGGRSQLARPFPYTGVNSDEVIFDLGNELRLSTNILYWLTVGLTHEIHGDDAGSYDLFRQAEDALAAWGDTEGKELLYFHIGRSAFHLRDYKTAEAYFARSLELDPNYVNALLGQGSIYLDRAQLFNVQNRVLPDDVQQCIDQPAIDEILVDMDATMAFANVEQSILLFETATEVAVDWPPQRGIAHLDLGLAYSQRAQFTGDDGRNSDNEALQHFDLALKAVEQAQPLFEEYGQIELMGHTALALGTIHFGRANRLSRLGEPDATADAARAAFRALTECNRLEQNERVTRWFREKIILCGCLPYLEEVKQLLTSLGAGSG